MTKEEYKALEQIKSFCSTTEQMMAFNEVVKSFGIFNAIGNGIRKVVGKKLVPDKAVQAEWKELSRKYLSIKKEADRLGGTSELLPKDRNALSQLRQKLGGMLNKYDNHYLSGGPLKIY